MKPEVTTTEPFGLARFAIWGALVGFAIGICDLLDTTVNGFTGSLSGSAVLGTLLIAALIHAAFGSLVGVAWGGLVRKAYKHGAKWQIATGLTSGRFRMSHQRIFLFIGAWVLVQLCGFTHLCLGAYPFGYSFLHLMAVVSAAFCLVVAIGVKLAPISRAARVLLWVLYLACLYWMQARLIFQFSKNPPLSYVHLIGFLHFYVLSLLALSSEWTSCKITLRGWSPSRRTIGFASLAAIVVLAVARPSMSLLSHQTRLVLHERTSMTYRLLWFLPDTDHNVSSEERLELCPAPVDVLSPAPTPQAPAARGVLMLFVDSLRADRVGRSNGDTPLTPSLSDFAAESTHFTTAYTTSPSTRRVARSLVTGRFNGGMGKDLPGKDTLGYVLQEAGVKTIAVSAHKNLRYSLHMFDTYRQFEQEVSNRSSITSESSTRNAIKELEKIDTSDPFFMLVHYYDPHAHYVPNDMFDFGGSELQRYDAEVAYTDHWIGKLLDELEQNPNYNDVAVILVGDHGDEFWEHRYRRHLLRIYDETMRVPLMIRLPGDTSGKSLDMPVSVADLYPTILGLFALSTPTKTLGRSLVDTLQTGTPPPKRPIYMISHFERAVAAVANGKKVIINRLIGASEFYDLEKDPNERNNLADKNPTEFHKLYCELLAWMEKQPF
ncbi:MAG: sulfatase-like hydrolase/transferase [Myxococcales bacterium]|nr:sulfatase-like hydrolase/transferase [Myxococcales bacterium]